MNMEYRIHNTPERDGYHKLYIIGERNGTMIIEKFKKAPWGYESYGFEEYDRAWLDSSTTLLSEEHDFVKCGRATID